MLHRSFSHEKQDLFVELDSERTFRFCPFAHDLSERRFRPDELFVGPMGAKITTHMIAKR